LYSGILFLAYSSAQKDRYSSPNMPKSASHHRQYNHGRYKQVKVKKWAEEDERTAHEKEADRLLDRQIGEYITPVLLGGRMLPS
jgi:hypothetical protein